MRQLQVTRRPSTRRQDPWSEETVTHTSRRTTVDETCAATLRHIDEVLAQV